MYNNNVPLRIKKAIQQHKDKQHRLGLDVITSPITINIDKESDFDVIEHSDCYIKYKTDPDRFLLHNTIVKFDYKIKCDKIKNPLYAPEYCIILEDIGISGGWSSLVCICEYHNNNILLDKKSSYDLFMCNEFYQINPLTDEDIIKNNCKTVIFFDYYTYMLDNEQSKIVVHYKTFDDKIVKKTVKPTCIKYTE